MLVAAMVLAVASATLFYAAGQPAAAGLAVLVFLAASRMEERGRPFHILFSVLLASPMFLLVRRLALSCEGGLYAWLMPGIAALALAATVALLPVEEAVKEEAVYLPRTINIMLSLDFRLALLAVLSAAAQISVALLYLAFLLIFTLTLLSALSRKRVPGRRLS